MRHVPSFLLVTGLCYCLAGCSGPTVVPATSHQPLSADQVMIYQEAPQKYEVLGVMVDPITPETTWNDQGDATGVYEKLKGQAGKMGANGVLLKADQGQYDLVATAGYKGTFYQVPMKASPKAVVVKAIYVHEQ